MKIVTDCAADLPASETRALDITVAPLYISFANEVVDSSKLSPDDFYDRLAAMQPNVPTTSQPSAGMFSALYNEIPDREIISVHISSGLSGTSASAVLGARDVENKTVHVVDSMTLSGGQRFQVLAASRGSQAGWSSTKILEQLKRVRQETEVVFTLDTLSYLARGGRIGRVQALAGAMLHLKPVIHVDKLDGKYSTLGKARTITRAMEVIAGSVLTRYGADQDLWVTVMHGKMQQQADALGELLKEKLKIRKLEQLRVSPVLGVHTGPGVVGAAVVPYGLIESLG